MSKFTATSTVMLNGKQAEDMLEKLHKKSTDLGKQWKKFSDAGDTAGMKKVAKEMNSVDKAIVKLKKDSISVEKVLNNLSGSTLTQIAQAQKKLNKEMHDMDRSSKKYKEAAKNMSLLNRELKKAKIQTGAWRSPMQKLMGSAKGLLPAFGWGAIIAGAVKGAKALFNIFKETANARREAERLTGLSGQPLADFTAKVQATADTFKKGFDEMLIGVNSFAKTMGISVDEALSKVNDGFLTGADSSGEFMDIIKEYGPQFKAAGLSADESIALISQQVKTGIYSDKGIDTIKEATISLREMTPATKAALDSIGISSNQLQQKLKSGSISIFEAIQEISNRMAELPPQSSVVGTAIADIFRGAGEDAGLEYITMLGTAELSLEKLKEGAGENAIVQGKLLEANTKLKLAWSELMGTGTGTFDAIKATAINLTADGIAGIAKGIAGVRDWFIELYNESLPVRAGFQYMLASWVSGFTVVKTALQSLWEQLKLGGNLIKAVLTFDLNGIEEAFQDYSQNMKTSVVDNAKKIATTWKDAFENTINGRIEPIKKFEEYGTITNSGNSTEIPDTNNKVTNSRQQTPEEIKSIDPRIEGENNYSETVLEQSKLRQKVLNKEQQAADNRAALDLQIQNERKAAYLSTLDTIIGVFGEESRIGKAALMAKQAYAIAETIINISKGTGKTAASVPFPANIPLIMGFVGQVATLIGTIKGATGKAKNYARGKYPIQGDNDQMYDTKYVGSPETGIYEEPHLGIFSEVPGQPEMVIDGVTLRNIQIAAPEIIKSIYAVRDGRNPREYAKGKYLDSNEVQNNLNPENLQESIEPNFLELTKAIYKLSRNVEYQAKNPPRLAIEMVEKGLKQYQYIKEHSGL